MSQVTYHAPSTGFYEIPDVVLPFDRGTKTVHLLDHVLPSGTQEQHAQRRIQSVEFEAEKDESFYCASMPDYLAIFSSLKDNEKARNFVKTSMRNNGLMTLTKPRYNPSGQDEAIHDFGLSSQYSQKANLVGPDGNVLEMPNKDYLISSTGMNERELTELFNSINGTPTFNWRKNSKPKTVEDRVARLIANSNGVDLNFGRNPSNVGPCLGVKFL